MQNNSKTASAPPGSLHPACSVWAKTPEGLAAEMEHREQVIRNLYRLVTEHHEFRVMREEYCQCLVCVLPENRRLMQEAWDVFHAPNVLAQAGRAEEPGQTAKRIPALPAANGWPFDYTICFPASGPTDWS